MINWQRVPHGTTIPTDSDLARIPLARAGEFDLSEREAQITRRRIYAINRDGICKYRTQRDGSLLMVWRIK